MKSWLLVNLLVISASVAHAQNEVDHDAVVRLGDTVQHVGTVPRGSEVDSFVEAMAPPVSDADKWFISVITMQNCPACELLKKEWQSNTALLALANPLDPKQSWSHFNVYDREDQSQAFRFQKIQVTRFPTILVQPPRTGKYGEPETLVFQKVYGGDPNVLAKEIVDAIRNYVAKVAPAPVAPKRDFHGQQILPPWQPTPQHDRILPQVLPNIDPIIPPLPTASSLLWSGIWSLVSGSALPAAIGLGIWVAMLIRKQRKDQKQPLLLDDETFAKLTQLLQSVNQLPQPPAKTTNSSK